MFALLGMIFQLHLCFYQEVDKIQEYIIFLHVSQRRGGGERKFYRMVTIFLTTGFGAIVCQQQQQLLLLQLSRTHIPFPFTHRIRSIHTLSGFLCSHTPCSPNISHIIIPNIHNNIQKNTVFQFPLQLTSQTIRVYLSSTETHNTNLKVQSHTHSHRPLCG